VSEATRRARTRDVGDAPNDVVGARVRWTWEINFETLVMIA